MEYMVVIKFYTKFTRLGTEIEIRLTAKSVPEACERAESMFNPEIVKIQGITKVQETA